MVGGGRSGGVSSVTTEFVKQPVITILQKFVERRKIWVTVTTALAAAADERIDAMLVRCSDESAPCYTAVRVQQLCDDN